MASLFDPELCTLIFAGILTVDESYRAIHWTAVILVGAMMPRSVAMVQSGVARLVALTGNARPSVWRF